MTVQVFVGQITNSQTPPVTIRLSFGQSDVRQPVALGIAGSEVNVTSSGWTNETLLVTGSLVGKSTVLFGFYSLVSGCYCR